MADRTMEAEQLVLEITVGAQVLLGREPKERLVSASWNRATVVTRHRSAQGDAVDRVIGDDFDGATIVANKVVEIMANQQVFTVELTVNREIARSLGAAAREHFLSRIRQKILKQMPNATLYVGWSVQ